jgi:hypothetical protein
LERIIGKPPQFRMVSATIANFSYKATKIATEESPQKNC